MCWYKSPENAATSAQKITSDIYICSNFQQVPQLRFKGFKQPWQEVTLKQVAKVVSGGTPKTCEPSYWHNGEINWFTPTELGESVYLSLSKRKISAVGLKYSAARMLPAGTILFTSRAGIGKSAILASPAATNQGFQSLIPITEKLDTYFTYVITKFLAVEAKYLAHGTTFDEISGKTLKQISLLLPELAEQQRIGKLFALLDQRYAQLELLSKQLEQYKEILMQKMLITV
ncbi:restriction endonuclease subunit S [Psittacicella hinzii]|nr:restriction endonuclease subunit S [Psittacicella hinzii]